MCLQPFLKSEYQKKYMGPDGDHDPHILAGVPSVKQSKTEEPALQHKKHAASEADNIPEPYRDMEPPLQRKKKPIQPRGSEGRDDYVLLGSQEKFSSNVVYKAKPAPVVQEVPPEPVEEPVTPLAPRPNPAPRVRVDTGAPQQARKHNVENKPTQNKTQAPVVQKSAPAPKPSHSEPKSRPQSKRPSPSKKQSPAKPAPVVQAPVVQNGTVPPEDQAPSEYAMKYKAGIAAPRKQGPKRVSEYQNQYAWKKHMGSSPLLDAEQVVYKSSTQLVPRKAKFSKTTEYRRQFHPWQSVPGPIAAKPKPAPAQAKLPRSKSVENLSPDKRTAAGSGKVTADTDPRLVQESLNPLRLHFPHGPFKKHNSEYAANFAPPQVFDYEKGAWKSAPPPQLYADKPAGGKGTESWFAEVRELRKRADEYKQRAQGTHFSREHTAQLLAQQAELWDAASTSSVLSALSLEQSKATRSVQTSPKTSPPKVLVVPPAGKRTAWGDDRRSLSNQDAGSVKSTSVASMYDEASVQSELSEAPTLVEDLDDEVSTPPGRVPTPKMVTAAGLRHHLDRTTPIRDALLSSPPRGQVAAPRKRPSSAESSNTVSDLETHNKHEMKTAGCSGKASQHVNKISRPIYGMPTRDTHILLDETASADRPLATNYVHSPVKSGKNKRDKFPEASIPSTIQEAGTDTLRAISTTKSSARNTKPNYTSQVTLEDIRRVVPEDDVLSTSVRSVASSCSLASEVLERARARRDDFWGINGRA